MILEVLFILIIIIICVFYALRGYFILNDITTNFPDVPEFEKIKFLPENNGRMMNYEAKNFNLQKKFYPTLNSFETSKSLKECFQAALETAKKMPDWTVINVEEEKYLIEGTCHTSIKQFQNDIVIQVRIIQKGSVVHVRSKSRAQLGDFGKNARCIRKYFKELSNGVAPQ